LKIMKASQFGYWRVFSSLCQFVFGTCHLSWGSTFHKTNWGRFLGIGSNITFIKLYLLHCILVLVIFMVVPLKCYIIKYKTKVPMSILHQPNPYACTTCLCQFYILISFYNMKALSAIGWRASPETNFF